MKSGRRNSYCYMRAAAAMAIVILHTFQYNVGAFPVMGVTKIASVAVRNCMLWAVPVFVMVTGALMLSEERVLPYPRLFFRYVAKTVLLLFICVTGGRLLDQYILGIAQAEPSMIFVLHSLTALFTAQGWQTFWYLYLLLAIYLSLPAFRGIAKGLSRKDIRYLLWVLFLFQSVLPFIGFFLRMDSGWYLLFYTIYPFYLLAGYYFRNGNMFDGRFILASVIVCAGMEAALTVGCFLGGWSLLIGEIERYSFPVVVVGSLSAFLLFVRREEPERVSLPQRMLLLFDRYTLDIYLIHLFLLEIMVYGLQFDPYGYGIGMVFAEAVGLFIVSFVFSYGLRQIFGFVLHFSQRKTQNKASSNDL